LATKSLDFKIITHPALAEKAAWKHSRFALRFQSVSEKICPYLGRQTPRERPEFNFNRIVEWQGKVRSND
jgi:hypothetical protein